MKKQFTYLKMSFVSLFLFAAIAVSAQVTIVPGASPIADAGAVLFYNPTTDGPTIKLKPTSLTFGANNDPYLSFFWSEREGENRDNAVSGSEKEVLVSATADGSYEVEELTPGYHVFRVVGRAGSGEFFCESDDFDEIVVYVLPPVTLTAGRDDQALLEYCEDNLPPTDDDKIKLSVADLTFDVAPNALTKASPAVTAFDFKYQWYYIKDGGVRAPITYGSGTVAGSSDMEVALGALDGVGSYTFEVDLEYAIRDKETRTYVTYTATAKKSDNTDVTIKLTPTPDKPVITIDGITD